MLDASICIYTVRKRPETVVRRFLSLDLEEICISSIICSELVYGVEKPNHRKNRLALSLFLSPIKILSFDSRAAEEYGNIHAVLGKGSPIGLVDMLIAGHDRSENLILVTSSTREFCRAGNLKIEHWI